MDDSAHLEPMQSFKDYTCRLCLYCSDSNVDIFGVLGQINALDSKIYKHLSLQILPTDELPKWICLQCQEALDNFHKLYTRVYEVQEQLQNILANFKANTLYAKGDLALAEMDNEDEPQINESSNNKLVVRRSRRHKTRRKSFRSVGPGVVKEEPTEECEVGSEAGIVEAVLHDTASSLIDANYQKDSGLSVLEDQEWILPNFNFDSDGSYGSGNDDTWKPSSILGRTRRKRSVKKSTDDYETLQKPITRKRRRVKKQPPCDDLGDEFENNELIDIQGGTHQKKLRITATHGTMPKPKLPPGSRKLVRARMNAMMMQFYGITCDICVNNAGINQTPVEPVKYLTFEFLCHHMQEAHNEKGYVKCCNCTMRDRKRAERHMLLHTQPGSVYKCNICGKQLSSQQSFRCHILLHLPDSERPYQCTHCQRGFVTKSDLVQHEHQHLPEEKRFSFTCDICGSRFSYESGLMIHKQRVHENTRSHLCDICAKIFNSRCDMERHREQIHGNVKRELCPECGKWFKGPSILKTHMRQHRGVVYQCQFCEKKYSVRSSWKAHLLRHSDEKPYKCPMCEKTFKLPGTLKMHLNQHTGELPYSCPFCPKKFASSGNYYTHRKRMHRDEVAEMKKATEASLAASGLLPPATVPPPTVTRSITEAIARAKEKAAAKPPLPAPPPPPPPPLLHPPTPPPPSCSPPKVPRPIPLPSASDLIAKTHVVQATSVVTTPAVVPVPERSQSHVTTVMNIPQSDPNSTMSSVISTLVMAESMSADAVSPWGNLSRPVSIAGLTCRTLRVAAPVAPPTPLYTSIASLPLPLSLPMQIQAPSQPRPLSGKVQAAQTIPEEFKSLETFTPGVHSMLLECRSVSEDLQAVQEV